MDLHAPGAELIKRQLSGSMRRKLRSKQRKLMELPNYRYFRASTPGEVDGFLDEFFRLKSAHLGALGLKNAFDQPGVKPFVREACHRGLADDAAERRVRHPVHPAGRRIPDHDRGRGRATLSPGAVHA